MAPTEQTRVFRLLRTLCSAGHVLLRAADESQLLREMCRVIADQRGYPLVAVGYAGPDPDKSIHSIDSVGIVRVLRLGQFTTTAFAFDLGHS